MTLNPHTDNIDITAYSHHGPDMWAYIDGRWWHAADVSIVNTP